MQLAFADRLEGDIGRHELGDRSGVPRLAGVLFENDLAGVGFDQHIGPAAAGAASMALAKSPAMNGRKPKPLNIESFSLFERPECGSGRPSKVISGPLPNPD